MTNELKIFLSSTKVDLEDTRRSILKFLEVLHSDIISMEVFGSDESRPKDFCLKQVRRCNLFIGIYAERYGSIDIESNLSITELEYLEALSMLKAGRLIGILVYIIDPEAFWPLNLVEREPKQVQKLEDFKKKLTRRHTVTFFKSTEDLPLLILHDVIQKIGLSAKQFFQPRKKAKLIIRKTLDRPIGMEYYTEELIPLFQGRENDSNKLLNQIIKYKMSLLIGASGIGKTSLINAGLFPRLHELGWRTVLIRPLTEPIENLRNSLWNQLLEGIPPKEFDFMAVVHSIAIAHKPNYVLIVIDQFEDILGTKASKDINPLTCALRDFYISGESNLRFLICYRGDVEAQIGTIWQKVSGSTEGLSRLYLGPLTKKGCEDALKVNLKALKIFLFDNRSKKIGQLITCIVEDLASESLLNGYLGVYPPFLQMLISKIYMDADKNRNYTELDYISAGRCRRIIAEYLIRQLKYLGKNEQKGREVLIAMVSSYGMKTQKTAEEISAEMLQDKKDVEKLLQSLIDLRIVRAIKDHFEIVHDYLAKTIITELVSSEERGVKKFKDLLASSSAAYVDTHAILTATEHIHIYKYRNKILCNEEEVKLLLISHIAGNGPIHFWLRSYSKEKVIAWVNNLLSEEGEMIRLNAYRFLIKSGEQISLHEVVEHFSDYKLKVELGEFILKLASPDDIPLLLRLHRKKAEEVVYASERALLKLVSLSKEEILNQIAKSTTSSSRHIFEILSLKYAKDLSLEYIRNMYKAKEPWKRFISLYALGEKGIKKDLEWLQVLFETGKLSKKYQVAVVKSIIRLSLRFNKIKKVQSLLRNQNPLIITASLEALEKPFPYLKLKKVFIHYKKFPFKTAKAIRELASKRDLAFLKEILKKIRLNPPARDIILAVCDNGGENEFEFLLKLFLDCEHQIDFWNAPVVFKEIAKLARYKHLSHLDKIIKSREFWKYHHRDERPKQKIPVIEFNNLYFVKRLVGVTYAKIASRKQFEKLRELLKHDYWIIWNAAANAIVKLSNTSDLPKFIEDAISSGKPQDAIIKVLCDLDERFYAS